MTRPLNLISPLSDFEALWAQADKRAKQVRVSKDKLRNLLMDHGRALGRLYDMGITAEQEDGFGERYENSSAVREAQD